MNDEYFEIFGYCKIELSILKNDVCSRRVVDPDMVLKKLNIILDSLYILFLKNNAEGIDIDPINYVDEMYKMTLDIKMLINRVEQIQPDNKVFIRLQEFIKNNKDDLLKEK